MVVREWDDKSRIGAVEVREAAPTGYSCWPGIRITGKPMPSLILTPNIPDDDDHRSATQTTTQPKHVWSPYVNEDGSVASVPLSPHIRSESVSCKHS